MSDDYDLELELDSSDNDSSDHHDQECFTSPEPSQRDTYDEEYYYEVYLPYLRELHEGCDDDSDDLSDDLPTEPSPKLINKSARKEVINEINEYDHVDHLNDKCRNKLSLTPKTHFRKEMDRKKH